MINDMSNDDHNGLYRKIDELGKTLNEVNTNVSLTVQEVKFLKDKVSEQNGRVGKNESRLNEFEILTQELLTEVKKFNTSEIAREKTRKSLKMWILDNVAGIGITLLTVYLIFRFGWK